MKGFFLPLLALLCLPLPSLAGGGSAAFREAFSVYVNVRKLEERSRIRRARKDLEEGARLELVRQAETELAAARKEFEAFARPEELRLGAWERNVVRNVRAAKSPAGVDKPGLDFLDGAFRKAAKGWSPLEWEAAGEWFGKPTEDAFLKLVFSMEEVPARPSAAKDCSLVVWLSDPISRYPSKAEAAQVKAGRARAKNQLERGGYVVEDLEIGAFARLDEQAEELHLALARRIDEGKPFTLVSGGYASAVLLRSLDLNPGLLQNPSIRGWVNVNGQLFGEGVPASRAPASLSKADRPLGDVWHELLLLREERLAPPAPLGAKFPVLNLVTLTGSHRPGPSLRDSLLPEGKTVYLRDGDAAASLQRALPLLAPRAPSGQRDL